MQWSNYNIWHITLLILTVNFCKIVKLEVNSKVKTSGHPLSVRDVDLQVNITLPGSWSDHKLYYNTNEQVIIFDNAEEMAAKYKQMLLEQAEEGEDPIAVMTIWLLTI